MLSLVLTDLKSPRNQGSALSVFCSFCSVLEGLKSLATVWPLFTFLHAVLFCRLYTADTAHRSRTSMSEINESALIFFLSRRITKAQKYSPLKGTELRIIPKSPGIQSSF